MKATAPIKLQGRRHILTIYMDENGVTHFRLFEGDMSSSIHIDDFEVLDGSVVVHEDFKVRKG